MATVTRTFLVDDLDGSTEDVQNVRISLDGTNFEMDREKLGEVRGARHPCHAAEDPPIAASGEAAGVGPGSGPGRAGLGTAERVQGVGPRAHPQEHPGRLRRRPLKPVSFR